MHCETTLRALDCKSRHWDIIAPVKNFFSEFDKDYAQYFLKSRNDRNLSSRSLWESQDKHSYITADQIKERNPRILPEVMHGKFKSVLCLYDDKVLMISSLKSKTAVIIQSKELHNTLSAVFEGLWGASQELISEGTA